MLPQWPSRLTIKHQCDQDRVCSNSLPCLEGADGRIFQLYSMCPTCKARNEELQRILKEPTYNRAKYGGLINCGKIEQAELGAMEGSVLEAMEWFVGKLSED